MMPARRRRGLDPARRRFPASFDIFFINFIS
jgi:hypothetical protein